MIYKKTISFFCIFFVMSIGTYSQDTQDRNFKNGKLLTPVFEKLYQLQSSKRVDKVNIVHVGDSHVQADMLTDAIRQMLQAKFGNGGYGFSFPYKMAKTNGTSYVKYTSDVAWESRRNIYPVTDVSIGLSGIGLYTNNSDFEIKVQANPLYSFNKVKLLYPTQQSSLRVCLPGDEYRTVSVNLSNMYTAPTVTVASVKTESEPVAVDYKVHVVGRRETLYNIARRNKTTVDQLKELNNLSSNTIQIGQNLIIPIPISVSVVRGQTQPKSEIISIPNKIARKSVRKEFKTSVVLSKEIRYESEYTLPTLSNEIVILPTGNGSAYNLSGVVLENDQQGVIYHSIGVNGAKVSDYNKYPLFFDQLSALSADLLVVSLGTNESFAKWSTYYYMTKIQEFIDEVRKRNPKMLILVMTPAPSLFKRTEPNAFIEDYAEALLQLKDCVVWDLLGKLGGVNAPLYDNFVPLMAKDKIHYTREGYQKQGELFATDFLTAYDNYVTSRKN